MAGRSEYIGKKAYKIINKNKSEDANKINEDVSVFFVEVFRKFF